MGELVYFIRVVPYVAFHSGGDDARASILLGEVRQGRFLNLLVCKVWRDP